MEILSSRKANTKIFNILQNANCLIFQLLIIYLRLIKNEGIII
jgi:hypothetical protein